jgi:hypothetical protein
MSQDIYPWRRTRVGRRQDPPVPTGGLPSAGQGRSDSLAPSPETCFNDLCSFGGGSPPSSPRSGQSAKVATRPSLVVRSQPVVQPKALLTLLPHSRLLREATRRRCGSLRLMFENWRVTPDGGLACARRNAPARRHDFLRRSAAREVAGGRTRRLASLKSVTQPKPILLLSGGAVTTLTQQRIEAPGEELIGSTV